MVQRHSVSDDGDLRKYYTAIPNLVFKLGLNPFELALYTHLKQIAGEDGVCWKSTATLSKEASMSAGTVSKSKASLSEPRPELGGKPLILISTEMQNGGNANHAITITDIWPENMAELERVRQAKATRSRDEGARSCGERTRSRGGDKEEPKNKNPEEARGAHARLMAVHDSNVLGGIPDAGAQGAAIKWLLTRYTPEQCEAEYANLRTQDWRSTPVTWLTVKKHIGGDLARGAQPTNGHSAGGEKILTDYGDWYTVEGEDGTPSKRYRTAEAFARETGRDVEEVKARWN
jgi:hypothetical protein